MAIKGDSLPPDLKAEDEGDGLTSQPEPIADLGPREWQTERPA